MRKFLFKEKQGSPFSQKKIIFHILSPASVGESVPKGRERQEKGLGDEAIPPRSTTLGK